MTFPPDIFDRAQLARNKVRAQKRFGEFSFIHEWTANILQDRLSDIKRPFTNKKTVTIDTIGSHDTLNLKPESTDLITSILTLHNVNDLPGVLLQIRQALKPDGLFIAAMFGGETLHELRKSLIHAEISLKGGASPRVHPMTDKQQMGALLQRAGFALPVVDSELLTVTYENMFKLMHDLRGMGETNSVTERAKINPGKALFMNAAEHYAAHFSDLDGRIEASFEIIFLLGWAPHDSQQKPLKPGSAKHKISDALNKTVTPTTATN